MYKKENSLVLYLAAAKKYLKAYKIEIFYLLFLCCIPCTDRDNL